MTELAGDQRLANDSTWKTTLRRRCPDALILAHFVLTLLLGFSSETSWRFPHDVIRTLILSQLMLIAFLGWSLPLWIGARLAWLFLVPLVPFIVLNMGFNIAVRLSRAPGHEAVYTYWAYIILPSAVPAFLIAMLVWLAFGLFGWKLREDQSARTQAIRLSQLFAFVGIFCCGLILTRESLTMQPMRVGLELLVLESRTFVTLLALPACVKLILCVWIGFRFKPMVAISIGCIWMATSNFAHFRFINGDSERFLFRNAYQGWYGFAVVMMTVLVLHWCGYQLVRATNPPQALSLADSDKTQTSFERDK